MVVITLAIASSRRRERLINVATRRRMHGPLGRYIRGPWRMHPAELTPRTLCKCLKCIMSAVSRGAVICTLSTPASSGNE